jgi:hypothetical protein
LFGEPHAPQPRIAPPPRFVVLPSLSLSTPALKKQG